MLLVTFDNSAVILPDFSSPVDLYETISHQGNTEASQRRLEILSEFDLLDITDDVTDLAYAILDTSVIPQKTATDAAHIAIATVHNIQFLLTWNCTHLANAEISIEIKSVCKSKGYECPIICTPEELMGEE